MCNQLIARVSVLDLDNYCRFRKAYIRAPEETGRFRLLSAEQALRHLSEVVPTLGRTNSVVDFSL